MSASPSVNIPVRSLAILAAPLAAVLLLLLLALAWQSGEVSRRDTAHAGASALEAAAAKFAARKLDLNPQRILISARTSGLAQAALQNKLLQAAAQAGVEADHLETRPPDDTVAAPAGVAPVSLSAEVRGGQAEVMGFLIALETGEPLLFIDRLDLTAAEPDPAAPPEAAVALTARVTVTGWRQSEGAP